MMRNDLWKNDCSYTVVKNFGEWQKRVYQGSRESLFGVADAKIEYFNLANNYAIEFYFDHGLVEIDFRADKFPLEKLNQLLAAVETENCAPGLRSMQWSLSYDRRCQAIYDLEYIKEHGGVGFLDLWPDAEGNVAEATCGPKVGQGSDDLDKLSYILSQFQKVIDFSDEILKAMLSEVKGAVEQQEQCIETLTTMLLLKDRHILDKLKEDDDLDEHVEHILNAIKKMIDANKFYQALALCSIISKHHVNDKEAFLWARRTAIDLLIKIKNEKIPFPLSSESLDSGAENEFDCDEQLFIHSRDIYRATKSIEDARYALRLLDQLSGGSGFEHPYTDIESLLVNNDALLIEHAKRYRRLLEVNQLQAQRIAELERQLNQQSDTVSETKRMGMFR